MPRSDGRIPCFGNRKTPEDNCQNVEDKPEPVKDHDSDDCQRKPTSITGYEATIAEHAYLGV